MIEEPETISNSLKKATLPVTRENSKVDMLKQYKLTNSSHSLNTSGKNSVSNSQTIETPSEVKVGTNFRHPGDGLNITRITEERLPELAESPGHRLDTYEILKTELEHRNS